MEGRHTSIVNAMAVSKDGRWAVSAGLDGRLMAHDLAAGGKSRILINSSHPAAKPAEASGTASRNVQRVLGLGFMMGRVSGGIP